jgi:hypothetical protein
VLLQASHRAMVAAQVDADRTLSERLYLESKWASLVSYGVTALLEDVLPLDRRRYGRGPRGCTRGQSMSSTGFISPCVLPC